MHLKNEHIKSEYIRWMTDTYLRINEKWNIREKSEVVSVEDKMRETLLRWFHHVQKNSIDTTVRKIDCSGCKHFKGERKPKKAWIKPIKNDPAHWM